MAPSGRTGSPCVGIPLQGSPPHLGAGAGSGGGDIAAVANDGRIEEVLVKVVGVLDHAPPEVAADPDVVEDRDMTNEFG
jgi:hypothetical protein